MAALAVLAALAGAPMGACANPQTIVTSTGGADDIKFLTLDAGGRQGVIKCARAPDGALSNCRRMRLVLEGE